ncbi:hypothetical protein EEB11_18780 [Pseudotabrizicola sediminis]|uniref:Transposase IS66 central domain-containing protein n=1 Tax=Pseudotabrizicola sediminis TaxID=2486418 RepID=A0ABY2KGU8_9RHOB|nr:hypothetical protein EEB11_18780 [Pseudotabrizicola sediminis]
MVDGGAKSPLGEALAYIAKYRDGLSHFLTDGLVEVNNNTFELSPSPMAPVLGWL